MMKDADVLLIDRILSGEETLYGELIDRYKRYVFTITLKILGNRPDAEEAAQDSFIKAFHHLKDFNRLAKFSTWLYRIAFNTAITYKRKRKGNFEDIGTTIIEYQEGEGSLEKKDKTKYIGLALAKLNDADRTALTLFYLQEFSLEEMAEIMNTPANTIKVRIHRARVRIAEELKLILQNEALTL